MRTARAVIDVESGTVSMKSDGKTMTIDCVGLTATSSSAASLCGVTDIPSSPNIIIDCEAHKVEVEFMHTLGNRPTFLTLEGSSSHSLQLQVTGEVTSPPIWQAKSGGDETPATKKECKKEAFVSNKRRPRRLTASTYRNLFRFTYPPRKWDEETAQGEERKKTKR